MGAVHADPNPANYACRDDGTVIVYDFGCIKRVAPEIIDAYRNTITAALERRYEDVETGLIELGVRNLDGPSVEHSYYEEWRNLLAEPYELGAPFDFRKTDLHLRAAQKIPTSSPTKSRVSSRPSRLRSSTERWPDCLGTCG